MSQNHQPHSIFASPDLSAKSQTSASRPTSRSGKFKDPIREELTTGLENVSKWLWWALTINGTVTALCTYLLNIGTSPVTGEEATPLAIFMFGVSILCGAFSGIAGFSLPLLAFLNNRNAKQIEKIRKGDYLARWDLDRDQWLAFIEDEKTKAKERVGTAVVIVGAIGLLLGIMLWSFVGFFGFVAIMAGACGLGYLVGKLLTVCRQFRVSRWKDKPFFTVIGKEGLFFTNAYYPFSTFGSGLGAVSLSETESMSYLVFTFYHQTQNGRTEIERRVPVPFGREAEAKQIVKRIN